MDTQLSSKFSSTRFHFAMKPKVDANTSQKKNYLVNQIRQTFESPQRQFADKLHRHSVTHFSRPSQDYVWSGYKPTIERKKLVIHSTIKPVAEQKLSIQDKLRHLSDRVRGVGKGATNQSILKSTAKRMSSASPHNGRKLFFLLIDQYGSMGNDQRQTLYSMNELAVAYKTPEQRQIIGSNLKVSFLQRTMEGKPKYSSPLKLSSRF